MTILINDIVYAKIMIHATQNSLSCVHGILLGTSPTQITDALPVSHSTPTKPIIDMALRFAEAYCEDINSQEDTNRTRIIGWYAGNEREGINEPNPVTKKIISGIQHGMNTDSENASSDSSQDAILIMINNEFKDFMLKQSGPDGSKKGFDVIVSGDKKSLDSVHIEGGDWSNSSCKIVDICHKDSIQIYDFEDHLNGGVGGLKERDWLRNPNVAKKFRV
jgi:hypothetical protein